MSFTLYGAGAAPGSSGTSITVTSRLSATAGSSNITLDLPGVGTAGSYNSVTVDAYGRITAGQLLGYVTSSGTSMTRTSAISFTVGSSNVTFDLSATGVGAGSYISVTVDDRGRVTSGSNSIGTAQIVGAWTSTVSSGDVQGLGSTWTVSRLSSDRSFLGNEVWASGVSVGSILSASRVSSSVTIIGNAVWSSGFSGPHLSALTVREGGTGINTLAVGDLLFGWSTSSLSRLPVGAATNVLKARSDGTIEWGTVSGSGNSLFWTSAISAQQTGSNVTLDLSATGVVAGSSYNSVTVDARGRITNAQTVAGGSGAPSDVSYLILGPADATLTKERLFVAGSGLTSQDGGAGSTYTVRTFPYYSSCSLSADTGRNSRNLDDSLLSLAVSSGKLYRFMTHLIFRTAATTTGLRFGATTPAFTILSGTGEVPVAAGGTGGVYHSYLTASGVSITGTGVALAGVDYLARLFGTIIPSSDGTITVQFATEINASRVSLMAGSHMELWQLT